MNPRASCFFGWKIKPSYSSPLVSRVVFTSFPLVSSVVFTSLPLVSSVVFTSFPLVSSVVQAFTVLKFFAFIAILVISADVMKDHYLAILVLCNL